jgi:hypothetical protein
MRGNKNRRHRENVHMKQRATKVVQDGEGFKVVEVPFYKVPLPVDRPSVEDLAAMNRPGCLPKILMWFARKKYGSEIIDAPPVDDAPSGKR